MPYGKVMLPITNLLGGPIGNRPYSYLFLDAVESLPSATSEHHVFTEILALTVCLIRSMTKCDVAELENIAYTVYGLNTETAKTEWDNFWMGSLV